MTVDEKKKSGKKKKILKIIAMVLSCLVLLVIALFWTVTSSSFITEVILPMAGNSIDMPIKAGRVNLSLFKSRLVAENVTVGPEKTPLVKADKLDASFSLCALLGGRFVFHDVLLDKAAITLAKDANGKWNYESSESASGNKPGGGKSSAKPASSASASEKPEKIFLDLRNIKITNSSMVMTAEGDGKTPVRLELYDMNISLPEFKNNAPANLTFKSGVTVQGDRGMTVRHGNWKFTLTAAFDEYLHPYEIKLDSDLDKIEGTIGGTKSDSNLALNIEASGDKKSIHVKRFCLRQLNNDRIKTDIQLSSHINFDPLKVKGKLKITRISAEIISIISQFAGLNPGDIGINLLSDFEYSEAGFGGGGKLELTRTGAAVVDGKTYNIPDLRLNSRYDFHFNNVKKALGIKKFTVELQERNKKVLSLSTDQAFTYLLDSGTVIDNRKPKLSLQLRQLDLSLMKLLRLPDKNFALNNGQLNGDLNFIPGPGKRLFLDADIKASGLDFRVDSTRFKELGFEQKISASVNRKLFIAVPQFRLSLKNKRGNILDFAGTGDVDCKKQTADFALKLNKFSSKEIKNLPLPPKTIKQIVDITGKLEPFSLTADSRGSVKFADGSVKLKLLDCCILQQDKKVLNLSFRPEDGLAQNLGKKTEVILNVNNLALKQCRSLLNDETLKNGYLNGKIIAKINNNWKAINLTSSLNINKLELATIRKSTKNLRFNVGFTASVADFNELNIRDFVCGMRENGHIILGLTGFGNLNPANGVGKFDLALNHLNYQALNLLLPDEFRNGTIKGNLKVNILDHFKSLKVSSGLNITQLTGGQLSEAIDGNTSFTMELTPKSFVCKEIVVDLSSSNGKVAEINGSTTFPMAGSGKPIVIKLSSKTIDVAKIKQIFADEEDTGAKKTASLDDEETTAPTKPAKPLHFDFGDKSYVLFVDLRGIKFNSELLAQVSSEVRAEKRRISVKHLQIVSNDDKLDFKGDFESTAPGIKYKIELKSDKFNLTPSFHASLDKEFQKMEGTLKNLNIKLSGTGLQPPVLWDNMAGSAFADFADVKIPNNFSSTPIGKIILLPFEIMIDIQKMVPSKVTKTLGKVSQFILDFRNDIKVLNFKGGRVDLTAGDGLIYIKDFHFTGEVVRNLSFAGQLGLGSRPLLDLKSSLNITGIILPVDMAGTVEKPKVNYRATTISFMTANAFNILDATGKIIEKGGDGAKEVIDNIFSKILK